MIVNGDLLTKNLNIMTDLQKEFEATGYTSWINSDLYPDGKIYTQEYTEWLEKQVQALRIALVVRQSKQFKCEKCGSDWGEVRATCFSCNYESEDLST